MSQELSIPENVDVETGEVIPVKSSYLETTNIQELILFKDIQDEEVEIRPDGLIYLPWTIYATRLRKAFGLSWSMVPAGHPVIKDNAILWPFHLYIQGHNCGLAYGEQQYYANNSGMTYGDALEGAKSNALMRLCKGIGIGLELWTPTFIRTWKEKYSEEYWDEKRKKNLWRKKGITVRSEYYLDIHAGGPEDPKELKTSDPRKPSTTPPPQGQPEKQAKVPASEDTQKKVMDALDKIVQFPPWMSTEEALREFSSFDKDGKAMSARDMSHLFSSSKWTHACLAKMEAFIIKAESGIK